MKRVRFSRIESCARCGVVVLSLIMTVTSAQLTGMLKDEATGNLLTAAVVQVEGKMSEVTATDQNGTFKIDSLEPGRYTLIAQMTGYSGLRRKIEITGDSGRHLDLSLAPIHSNPLQACDTCEAYSLLVGEVRAAHNNEPVESVQVHIQIEGEKTVVRTDNDGIFSFHTRGRKNVRLSAQHPRYHSSKAGEVMLHPGRVSSMVLRMRALKQYIVQSVLHGSVVDGSTNEQILNASVSLVNTGYSTQTDKKGRFSLQDVAPGTYTLLVTKWGYNVEAKSGIDLDKGDSLSLKVALAPKKSIGAFGEGADLGAVSGKVLNESSEPVENARIMLDTGMVAPVYTGYAGTFSIDSVSPGVYDIKAWAGGYDTTRLYEIDVWGGEMTSISITLQEHTAIADGSGVVQGVVIDGKNQQPLSGVKVRLDAKGEPQVITDLKGRFSIENVAAGTYTLTVAHSGYNESSFRVKAEAGEKVRADVVMKRSDVQKLQKMSVTSVAAQNTEAALLKERKEAFSIQDNISAEQISRSGAGDAAEAMKMVTGASIVGGKYVYIRGLGGRYTNTLLNGAPLPSPDPYKKVVPADLFPTHLMEHIKTQKTFSPDRPGNFTGGSVDIKTKSFPEQFECGISASVGYNTYSTFNDSFFTYQGGSLDWLGIDDGTRELPEPLQDRDVEIPSVYEARFDDSLARQLDSQTSIFNNRFYPITSTAPLNRGISFSLGNKAMPGNNPLGYVVSLTYDRSYSHYNNGFLGTYTYLDSAANNLVIKDSLHDTKSTSSILWGALLHSSYKIFDEHTFSLTYMYNKNTEDESRFLSGYFMNLPTVYKDGVAYPHTFHAYAIHYQERDINSLRLTGEHTFDLLYDLGLDWGVSMITTRQDEPDLRLFAYQFGPHPSKDTTIYKIDVSGLYQDPSRYYRCLEETTTTASIDLEYPFYLSDVRINLRGGYQAMLKNRSFRVRAFEFHSQDTAFRDFGGDKEAFFDSDIMGIINADTTGALSRYSFGHYVSELGATKSNYDARQLIPASYLMSEVSFLPGFDIMGGVRLEGTTMKVATIDPQDTTEGVIESVDLLPAAGVKYELYKDMNLRFNYGKTIARPTMREMAPFASFDFFRGRIFNGNPEIETGMVQNFDLRWEWYPRPGEVAAFSLFYKNFDNPIQLQMGLNKNVKPINVEKGIIRGAECELSTRLGWVHPNLKPFSLGGNLTYMDSRVLLGEEEIELAKGNSSVSAIDSVRPFQGMSPYLFNIHFTYHSEAMGTEAGIYFHTFGERLSAVSLANTPDVYEYPSKELKITCAQKIAAGLRVKVKAKNLLNSPLYKTYKGYPQDAESHREGRSFSVGVSYDF